MTLSTADLEANVWWPGVYTGSNDPDYTRMASELASDEVIELVQQRIKKDGETMIEYDMVGPNENKMRIMMGLASDPSDIIKALLHASNADKTVDYLCRDLANYAKVVANK